MDTIYANIDEVESGFISLYEECCDTCLWFWRRTAAPTDSSDRLEALREIEQNGTMEQFIDFADELKGDRKKFFCPESHSIAETMVAADVGAGYLAWWGPINEARGNFMRACQGSRLAFVTVEKNWSAASVYRAPDGTLHGFVGSAERENGKATTFKFVCTNEDVTYYPDGDMENGQFRKKGEAFVVLAKPPKGDRSRWLKIVPGHPR